MSDRSLVGVGFCAACRTAVELDEQAHCPLHPFQPVFDVRMVEQKAVEQAKANLMLIRARRLRKELIGWFIAISGLLLLGYVVIFMIEF